MSAYLRRAEWRAPRAREDQKWCPRRSGGGRAGAELQYPPAARAWRCGRRCCGARVARGRRACCGVSRPRARGAAVGLLRRAGGTRSARALQYPPAARGWRCGRGAAARGRRADGARACRGGALRAGVPRGAQERAHGARVARRE